MIFLQIRRYRRFSGKYRKIIAVLLAVIIVSVIFLEVKLKPVIAAASLVQAKSFAVTAINETTVNILDEMNITNEELENVTVSEDGTVRAISSNTVTTNKLKNKITLKAQEALSNIQNERIDIPIGTVIGGELLTGKGPCIPVYISISGTVSSDFEESFESGGINQTVHKLSVRISADINIITAMTSASETVTTSVLIGETVIIGDTHDGMISMNNAQ